MIKQIFRTMQLNDLQQVLAIEQEQDFAWSENQLQECLTAGYQCVVLTIEKEIQGFAIMAIAFDEAEILNIVIKASSRGQGYGKKLLEHLFKIAAQHQLKSVFLEVRISNLPACNLYERTGFKQVGIRKNYYRAKKGHEDAIIMQRDIIYHGL